MDAGTIEAGTIFEGRYRIEREVGRGSFGIVYLAIDQQTGESRAIKILLPWTRGNPSLRHRLQREARLTQMLKSPHAVRIYDVGESRNGDLYVVMEFLDGRELNEILQAEGKLSPAKVSAIVRQVLDPLGEAHQLGVIHRDLKPHNIFICNYDGRPDFVKVLDFGIAKVAGREDGSGLAETTRLTAPGGILGTPAYMSPEQCRSEEFTPASDFYSLGIVLYELLVGQVPFDDRNAVRVMIMHNQDTPPPFRGSLANSALGRAVMKALEKEPQQRFSTAAEFAAALEEASRQSESARTATPVGSTSKGPGSGPAGQQPAVAAPLREKPKYRAHKKSKIVGYALSLVIVALLALVLISQFMS